MLKSEFKEIFDDEVEFHGKRFAGRTDEEKQFSYKRFLTRYYESLPQGNKRDLKSAFKACREHYEFFPKVSQLLKYWPHKKCPTEQQAPRLKFVEPAPAVTSAINKAKTAKGSPKFKIGEKQLRENISLCKERWYHQDWDKVLDRWLKEDEQRLDR